LQGRAGDFAILAAGVAAVSTAAVLIREAAAPALVIAAYRLTLASLPLGLVGVWRRWLRRPRQEPQAGAPPREAVGTLVAGAFLAAHFGFWIASVQQTSIITSVVLVTAQPLFVAVASGPLLHERVLPTTWAGIAAGAAGALLMVANDLGRGAGALQGDLFALLGAGFAAAYIMSGRYLRAGGAGWLAYVTGAYSAAAVLLVAAALVAGHAFGGYSPRTYLFLVLLALVPQLIGHTAINRSLGFMPAATVAMAILGEPVGATLLGLLILGETPGVLQLAGAALVLAGVWLGVRGSPGGVVPSAQAAD
jgi:drug/metabolite transporter (DMT)-like permease